MIPLSPSLPQDERSFLSIGRMWHNQLVTFVQDGLPKIVVALLIAFLLQRIVLFFVKRLRRRADSLVGNAQRAGQLRTVAGIVRASAYALIGAYLFVQVLGAIGVPLGISLGIENALVVQIIHATVGAMVTDTTLIRAGALHRAKEKTVALLDTAADALTFLTVAGH